MRIHPSAVLFWAAAVIVGSWEPSSAASAGARVERPAPGHDSSSHERRAWEHSSTLAAASCASEPWKVNVSDLTVTAGYAGLLHTCTDAVSGAEPLAPTVQLLVNSTFRIAPGECASGVRASSVSLRPGMTRTCGVQEPGLEPTRISASTAQRPG